MVDLLIITFPLLLIPLIFINEIKAAIKQRRCNHPSYSITGTSNFAFVLWSVHACDKCGHEKYTMKSKYDI